MSTDQAEERALEVMRKELASERMPDLPWDDMERELMARIDDAPMTSQPRSLDARIEDVPVSSVRDPRTRFVQISFAVLAAAAVFALFWMSPLHSGKPIVIKTATPSDPAPASSPEVDPTTPESSTTNAPAPQLPTAPSTDGPTRTITSKDVTSAFKSCIAQDKHYGTAFAAKLKGEKLTVFLKSDGRIDTIRFDSPLEPKTMPCVFDKLRTGRFAKPTGTLKIRF